MDPKTRFSETARNAEGGTLREPSTGASRCPPAAAAKVLLAAEGFKGLGFRVLGC